MFFGHLAADEELGRNESIGHYPHSTCSGKSYILKTPNLVGLTGALRAALSPSPSTIRVSLGSIMPSSHSLEKTKSVING